MRVLDLFCGRWGWSRAFAARGWDCIGVDLIRPAEIPDRCRFFEGDILRLSHKYILEGRFDFVVASPPCEQFSVHGMRHFHKNPPYPYLGETLFAYTLYLCKASKVLYVIENVRAAQQFVGKAVHHCGPYYLWGNAVPTLIPRGIQKGISMGGDKFKGLPIEQRRELRKQYRFLQGSSRGEQRKGVTADAATIPPELANCVAAYAERLLEQRAEQRPLHREAAK